MSEVKIVLPEADPHYGTDHHPAAAAGGKERT